MSQEASLPTSAESGQLSPGLVDPFGRRITYVRLSITDRCDLRCVYCMSEQMTFSPRSQLLTLEEMARLARCFSDLGVTKLRVTGGEPLVRPNVVWLFERLGELPGVRDLTLTTNATQLGRYAQSLKDAGLTRINISLDTLKPERFRSITRVGHIERTLAGLDAALRVGFGRIKLNAVVLKHRNHDEVVDLVRFAIARGVDISFIEEMPLGVIGDHDRAEAYYSSDAIRRDLAEHFELLPSIHGTGGPSQYFNIAGEETRVGFISPHSHNFCGDCNRVRVTAQGRLLLCLGQEHSADLRRVLRGHPTDDERVRRALLSAMDLKPQGHEFDLTAQPVIFRHMNSTGG
ncbi:GTP 3',8-cyclase MoaA [Thiorhodococcus mannitoliphagus]|uniref:GTP 3',8-cyclase n=1 Tax=Thiorhodococcus mannitoliphagus TaxID=329406 RepID=A0A6P1E083_9GAMM|nr:GTP 3',8-cyclase MoaA [Thiorhodococcus mannitoliphagus]NEX23299.1 GTP 3',8-cyclase MoaA [Thiorhodococcus mannitoliphagus]